MCEFRKRILVLFVFIFSVFAIIKAEIRKTIISPDEKYVLTFIIEKNAKLETCISYFLMYEGKVVVEKSELDIVLDNHISELAMAIKPDDNYHFINDMDFISQKDTSVNTTWYNAFGERSIVKDEYNQSSFLFEKRSKKGYQMQIDIRMYNTGAAIRYYFPTNPKGLYYKIVEENTEFVFPEGTKAWYARWAQAPYELLPLRGWIDQSERPLTCVLPNGLYVSLAEAAMVDYSRTKFQIKKNSPGTIVTVIDSNVDAITDFTTPWRVIMTAGTPGQLLENNDILLNLNEPCKISNTDWIKPGKIMREITQTNQNSKAQIDFSSKNGVDYLLYDWKWYGPAFDFNSDASTVDIDLDLHHWIEYGKEKGVGVWVYVNQQALLSQMREIFPLYKKWGIKGVKFGFVQVGSYRWTTWLHEAIKLAAQNELMVNIHDEFRTTGETRTWPNIVSVEGIRGNEEFPDATHNCILPFTRFVGGVGDYTICYMDKRIKTTHAHQLALGVIYFSPLQTIYWYDKPEYLIDVPETEFFKTLPTVWDDTKVLSGEIGEHVIIARRKDDDWYIGAITNVHGRELEINFDFLPRSEKYEACIYEDDANIGSKTGVMMRKKVITSKTNLKFTLIDSGGVAIKLVRKSK
ncbi:glycoside hydrolase family 97 catalytic domain-containing protein [Geofilum sp. OHC36d9]|uniref:glycoside hydrolase family 97 catalytic domain-containing protein n=1 Tax=Geofilum sp. OHC36d9 TaxID=3458413 RepID=UPI00403412C7